MKKLLNWFRLKSDCCKAELKNTDVHITRYNTHLNIYECSSCEKEYITL